MLAVESGNLVEGNQVHAVVQVNVTGTRHYHEFLRFRCLRIHVIAEVAGVDILPSDEQDGPGRNVRQGAKRTKINVRGPTVGGKATNCPRVVAAFRGVELEKLRANRIKIRRHLRYWFLREAANHLSFTRVNILPALFGITLDGSATIRIGGRVLPAIPVSPVDVVYCGSSHGLDAGINLCGTQGKPTVTTHPQRTDTFPIYIGQSAKVVDPSAEVLDEDFWG